MKIAACYIRVSTDEQLEFSPDAQKRAILEYAKKNDYIIDEEFIFIDEGISGRKAEKRPSFQRMISTAKIKPRPFDVILVHRFDRFARNREDSVVYKSLLRKEYGIKVISITEQLEDDKFSVILEAMLEAMAEYYSLNLSDEVKKGMTEKARRGGILSKAPFGYKNNGGAPTIIDEEAELVRLIFNKISTGEMTPFTLAKYLNNNGLLTGKGNTWSSSTIKQILKNPFYAGWSVWNRMEGGTMKYKHESEWIVVEGKHVAIIDQTEFDEVQKILLENKIRRERPNDEHCHWLSAILKCSNCGCSLSLSDKAGRYPFFQCHSYNKGKCGVSHYVPQRTIEEAVILAIKKFLDNPYQVGRFITREKPNQKTELSLFEIQLKKAEDKLVRVKSAFSAGIDTLDEYRDNKLKITSEIDSIKSEIEKYKNRVDDTESKKELYKNLSELLNIISNKDYSISYKNSEFKKLISHIIFYKETKEIEVFYLL